MALRPNDKNFIPQRYARDVLIAVADPRDPRLIDQIFRAESRRKGKGQVGKNGRVVR
jgi:hypothetical protein